MFNKSGAELEAKNKALTIKDNFIAKVQFILNEVDQQGEPDELADRARVKVLRNYYDKYRTEMEALIAEQNYR
jgi:hypothetical protein